MNPDDRCDIHAEGVFEALPDLGGFLRSPDCSYLPSADDIYVPRDKVNEFGLRAGDTVACRVRPPRRGEKYFVLTEIDWIKPKET